MEEGQLELPHLAAEEAGNVVQLCPERRGERGFGEQLAAATAVHRRRKKDVPVASALNTCAEMAWR